MHTLNAVHAVHYISTPTLGASCSMGQYFELYLQHRYVKSLNKEAAVIPMP